MTVPNTTNLSLSMSVGSNTLIVALKGENGNDPSITNQVKTVFRNVNPLLGTPTERSYEAALSATVTSGATLGMVGGTPGRLYYGQIMRIP